MCLYILLQLSVIALNAKDPVDLVGKLVVNEDDMATDFSHNNEIAKPNYYKVKMTIRYLVKRIFCVLLVKFT